MVPMLSSFGRLLGCAIAVSLVALQYCEGADANRIGISWGTDATPRWHLDEEALRARLDERHVPYVFLRSGTNTNQQAADVGALLDGSVGAIIVLAFDSLDLMPVIARAQVAKIPVVAYDRPIPSPSVFYVSYDSRMVGRLQARAILDRRPTGRYAEVLGDPGDLNSLEIQAGYNDILSAEIASGNIVVRPIIRVPKWSRDVARQEMASLLAQDSTPPIDAVLVANDNMAAGVIEALDQAGRQGVSVSGQDSDTDALRRIADTTQTMTVFKDSAALARVAADVALELANGRDPRALVNAVRWKGGATTAFQDAIMLRPVAIDRENLQWLFARGYASQQAVCQDLRRYVAPAACW
jgi:D-xylose transport system substrate-binding protein